MSTVAPRSPASPNVALNPALVDSEGYIDDHIRRTRRSLKLVDAAAGILTLAVGLLGFVLVAGLVDHWIVPGGLGPMGRAMMFGVLLVGVVWYAWRQFVPLLRSINPVYAAHTIEQSAPSLKNSLLNVLLFRTHRQDMSAKVYHALEQQAAQRLSASHADAQIDHRALLRLGYALVAITAICALYSVLSPKNLGASAVRVLAPWTDIAPPSRVHISNIKPGDASVAIGERVAISAEITGASDDDAIRVHYSTDDEALVDESIVMTRPTTALHFSADLPRATDGGSAGIQQPMEYWIEAGDARSPKYKLSVFQRPTIVVQRVRYVYPDYTREPPVTVDHVGDIRGIEGTTVTVEALASEPIKTAYVDFDGDGTSDKRMTVDGDHATVSFTLELRDDRRTPWHLTYALRFTTPEGRTNDDPVQHRLDVSPDYTPEVRITRPEEPELSVHAGDTVMIAVEARDPDFSLGGVRLVGRTASKDGSGEVDVLLADLLAAEHAGPYKHLKPFVPADVHLRPGDVLEYWAEARDNRRPDANITLSERRRLRILDDDAPVDPPQNDQGQGGGQQQGDGGGEEGESGAAGGKSGGSGGESESGEGDPQEGASGAGGKSGGEGESQESDSGAEGESQAGGSGGDSTEQSGDNAQGGGSNQSDGSNDAQASGQQNQDANNQDGQGNEDSQNADASQQPGEGGQAGGNQGAASERVSSAGDQDAEAMSRISDHIQQSDPQEGADGEGSGAQADQQQQTPNGEKSGADQSTGGESAADGENTNGALQDNETSSEQTQEGSNETPAGADGANNETNGGSPAGDESAGQPGAPEAGNKQTREQADGNEESQSGAPNEAPTDNSKGDTESDARGDQGGDRSGEGRQGGGQQAENAGQGDAGSHEPSDTGANQSSDPGAGEPGTQAGGEQLADGETGKSSGDQAGEGSETGDAQGENPEGAGGDQQPSGQPGGENPGAREGSQQNGAPGESSEQSQGNSGSEQQPGAEGEQSGDAGKEGQGEQSEGSSENASSDAAAEQSGASPSETGNPSDSGAQPGGQSTGAPSDSGDQSQQNGTPPGESPREGGAAGGDPTGGTSGATPTGDSEGTDPGGDAARLDFARKQTDLVLNRLDDQLAEHKVDPSLLKSLGWTEDELRAFVNRWKSLKAAAEAPGDGAAEAQQALDQAIKAIGIRPRSSISIQGAATPDEIRDLNEAARKAPAAEYADRVRAYLRAAAEEE